MNRFWSLSLPLLSALLAYHVALGPHLFDAGELASAAYALGGSHPPGQPLHALLAKAITWLPLGPMAARLAWLSALCVVIAAHCVGTTAEDLLRATGANDRYRAAYGAAAASTILTEAVLRQALRIEVYGLSFMLATASMLWATRFATRGAMRDLPLACLAAGLCAAVHPPQALSAVAYDASLVLLMRPAILKRPEWILTCAAAFLLPALALYGYLPLRAHAGASMWGDPRTTLGLLDYLRGHIYAKNLFSTEALSYPKVTLQHLHQALREHAYLPLLAALLWVVLRLPRRLGVSLLLAFVLSVAAMAIQPLEERNPDNVAYLMPALSILTLACVVTGLALPPRVPALFSQGLLLLAAVHPASATRLDSHLHSDLPALDTAMLAFSEAPPNRAVALLSSDVSASNLMMLQTLEGARPDLALFIEGLATNSFHWRSLAHHPAFDGRPIWGTFGSAQERLIGGLVHHCRTRVAVAFESPPRVALASRVVGPYLLALPNEAPIDEEPHRLERDLHNLGERLDTVLAGQHGQGIEGDHHTAGNYTRSYLVERTKRLLQAGETKSAMIDLVAALQPLPTSLERALLEVTALQVHPRPPVVTEPETLFTSRQQAGRTASALLFSLGEVALATSILAAQADDPSMRTLLQQAYLLHASGDTPRARAALRAVLAAAPNRRSQAAPLSRALGQK